MMANGYLVRQTVDDRVRGYWFGPAWGTGFHVGPAQAAATYQLRETAQLDVALQCGGLFQADLLGFEVVTADEAIKEERSRNGVKLLGGPADGRMMQVPTPDGVRDRVIKVRVFSPTHPVKIARYVETQAGPDGFILYRWEGAR